MKLQYSQKTENKLKVLVCPESMYIPQKVSQLQLQINMAS